jgi:prolyl oligopeptidase
MADRRRSAFFDYADKTISRPRDEDRVGSSIAEMVTTKGDEVLYRVESYTRPFAWMRFRSHRKQGYEFCDGVGGARGRWIRGCRSGPRKRDIQGRVQKIPLRIIQRRGIRKIGDIPTILTGYGGFGISTSPNFEVSRRLWLDQGGIIAVANIRGGGEFGEKWHTSGNLTNKQNVFDDFVACAQRLVALKYTNPSKLAIEGGQQWRFVDGGDADTTSRVNEGGRFACGNL